MKIVDVCRQILEQYLLDEGYELHNIEYVKEGKDWFLRVYIDNYFDLDSHENYEGISLDDCQKVSNYLSEKLDEMELDIKYFLEVSSPGLERALITDKDYIRFKGEMVDIKLYKGYEGKKKFVAKLLYREEDNIHLEMLEKEVVFKSDEIAKINLHIEF